MVEKVTYNQPEFIDNGSVDWGPVRKAFQQIFDTLNEHANEMKAIVKHDTRTISYALEDDKEHMILRAGKHLRSRVIHAYAVLGGAGDDTRVTLPGLTTPIEFTKTEKTGKMKIFNIERPDIHFVDNLTVIQTANRKIMVYLTLESREEEG